MNLKYNVLWFEDNERWFNVHADILEEELDEIGFDLIVRREMDSGNVGELCQDQRFDLIAVDLNLDNGSKGHDVINEFRANGVFTEVVFYSSSGPQAVRRKMIEDGSHVDGVYCIDRNDFETQIMSVIDTTIKKVQDLNNMRGLVMAALADYDSALNDFLLAAAERHGIHDHILGKVKERVERQHETQMASVEKFKDIESLEEALTDHNLSSYGRVCVVLSVLKRKKKCATVAELKAEIQDFQRNLIKERNLLAHVREDPDTFPPKLIGKDVEYCDEVFRSRRLELRRHLGVTRTLIDLINSGHFDGAFESL